MIEDDPSHHHRSVFFWFKFQIILVLF